MAPDSVSSSVAVIWVVPLTPTVSASPISNTPISTPVTVREESAVVPPVTPDKVTFAPVAPEASMVRESVPVPSASTVPVMAIAPAVPPPFSESIEIEPST